MLDATLTWDMQTRDLAYFTKVRRLRCYRNDVLALHDWFEGDGYSENESCSPGTFLAGQKQSIGGKEYSLIFLPHAYNRGNEQTFEIKRTVRDSFPAEHDESIGVEVLEETERIVIKAIWPRSKPPERVRVQGNQIGSRDIPIGSLTREPGGRRSLAHELVMPAVGDTANIYWDW